MGWMLSIFVIVTHFHIISGVKALQTNKAATFYCLGGTPPSCRAEPVSPWHLVRAFARWHPQLQLPCTPPQTCDPWGICNI